MRGRAAMAGAVALGLALAAPGMGQGLPGSLPGLGQAETPEQRRDFCQRVAGAAMRCGPTLDISALGACLARSLPPQDSLRVAQVTGTARGNPGALLAECGISAGR